MVGTVPSWVPSFAVALWHHLCVRTLFGLVLRALKKKKKKKNKLAFILIMYIRTLRVGFSFHCVWSSGDGGSSASFVYLVAAHQDVFLTADAGPFFSCLVCPAPLFCFKPRVQAVEAFSYSLACRQLIEKCFCP